MAKLIYEWKWVGSQIPQIWWDGEMLSVIKFYETLKCEEWMAFKRY